jgi:hypothetical protein
MMSEERSVVSREMFDVGCLIYDLERIMDDAGGWVMSDEW